MDNRNNEVIKIKFASRDCRRCPSQEQCFRSQKKYPRRMITIHPEEPYQALQAARQRETTPEYSKEYARCSGIEGTLSRGIRTCGMRRSRYIGLPKVHLGNLLSAVAINFSRLSERLSDTPKAKTRQSAFRKFIGATAAC